MTTTKPAIARRVRRPAAEDTAIVAGLTKSECALLEPVVAQWLNDAESQMHHDKAHGRPVKDIKPLDDLYEKRWQVVKDD